MGVSLLRKNLITSINKIPKAIHIRKASLLDVKQIQSLATQSVLRSCSCDYNKKQIFAWTFMMKDTARWKCAILNQFCVVAIMDGCIVGFGSLSRGKYLDFLYVHYLFQRQGIASAVYEVLKKRSLQIGSKRINTCASKTAKNFFLSKQFTVKKINRRVFGGVAISNYAMREN